MSVQPGPTFKRYAANGIAPTYAIPFLLLDAADLQITLNGVLITSGFSLAGVGNPTSSCTFTIPPTGDLLFQQVMTFQRLTDYQINGDFLAQTVNPDFDRLWLAVKQLFRDNGRALTAPLLEPEGIPSLPIIANRALRMLAFDALGRPTPSNLTMDQIEQQPALALAAVVAAQAAAGASQTSANASQASAVASTGSATAAAASAAAALASELAAATYASDPWALQPIGVPIPLLTHLAGVTEPPTNKSYRYIKLNAADAYNTGVLTSESVTGSAPLVLASATISLAGSPLNGLSVSLINTERRSVRAGSSGTLQNHQMQGHVHGVLQWSTAAGALAGGGSIGYYTGSPTGSPISDGTNGTPLVGDENRSKNIGATYYMRIK